MNPRYSRYEIDWALLLSALRLRSQIPVYRWSLAMDLLDAATDYLTPKDWDQIRGWMRA